MKLRPYQYRAVATALRSLMASRSALVVMPTGTGKTVVFGHIVADYVKRGRVLVLAHREELLEQAASKIERICGAHCEVEIGDRWSCESSSLYGCRAPVVVSTVQTQVAGMDGAGRMSRFRPEEFSLVVVDEAHHACASTYRRTLNYYIERNQELKIVGVTATPDRHDELALGSVFDVAPFTYSILDAIQDGWLVGIEQKMVTVDGLDFSQCRTTAGDLNGADLAATMEYEDTLHRVASSVLDVYDGKTTLVFAASVAHASRMVEIFNRHQSGLAKLLTGKTNKDERRLMLEDYGEGRFPILVNVGVATEGFDIPAVEVVIVARPTLSRSLYAQMIGRGTRPVDGLVDQFDTSTARRQAIHDSDKPALLVMDFVGNSGRHKLIHAADILGGKGCGSLVVARAKAAMQASGGKADVIVELERAKRQQEALERQQQEAAEARRRQLLIGRASFSMQTVNPFDVFDVAPPRERGGWDRSPQATTKQKELLERFGVDGAADMTVRQASVLINEIFQRQKDGKCTYKQAKMLQRHGYSTDASFEDAKVIIDGIMRPRRVMA